MFLQDDRGFCMGMYICFSTFAEIALLHEHSQSTGMFPAGRQGRALWGLRAQEGELCVMFLACMHYLRLRLCAGR